MASALVLKLSPLRDFKRLAAVGTANFAYNSLAQHSVRMCFDPQVQRLLDGGHGEQRNRMRR